MGIVALSLLEHPWLPMCAVTDGLYVSCFFLLILPRLQTAKDGNLLNMEKLESSSLSFLFLPMTGQKVNIVKEERWDSLFLRAVDNVRRSHGASADLVVLLHLIMGLL